MHRPKALALVLRRTQTAYAASSPRFLPSHVQKTTHTLHQLIIISLLVRRLCLHDSHMQPARAQTRAQLIGMGKMSLFLATSAGRAFWISRDRQGTDGCFMQAGFLYDLMQ